MKRVAPGEMAGVARDLAAAAADLAGVAESAPVTVDAGPFTPWIVDLVNAVAANTGALVTRVDRASELLRLSAREYADAEQRTVEAVKDIEAGL